MELLELLNSNRILAHGVSFLILLWLMRIFAWKRILKVLDGRRQRIASQLSEIEGAQAESNKLKSEYGSRLKLIDAEAKKIVQAAEHEARRISEEIKRSAREEARNIVEGARKALDLELIRARDELKDELVDITVQAAEHLIEERLSEEEDKKIVEDFLKGIKSV